MVNEGDYWKYTCFFFFPEPIKLSFSLFSSGKFSIFSAATSSIIIEFYLCNFFFLIEVGALPLLLLFMLIF